MKNLKNPFYITSNVLPISAVVATQPLAYHQWIDGDLNMQVEFTAVENGAAKKVTLATYSTLHPEDLLKITLLLGLVSTGRGQDKALPYIRKNNLTRHFIITPS